MPLFTPAYQNITGNELGYMIIFKIKNSGGALLCTTLISFNYNLQNMRATISYS
jgi:hypothetical protein